MPQTREKRLADYRNKWPARKAAYEAQGICSRCKVHPLVPGMKCCQVCREKMRGWGRKPSYRALARERAGAAKDAAFVAYGGYKCACCGETEPLFLEIDHVNNDGNILRYGKAKQRLKGNNLYYWLRRHKYPDGFQVLCSSCNQGKHRNGGVCPHQSPEWDRRFIGACD